MKIRPIDVLNNLKGHVLWPQSYHLSEDEARTCIEALEQQKTGKWIPVSKRIPEDRRTVLVTAYWHETYQVMEGAYYGDGVWWCVPFNNCGDHMQRLKPKAWMHLPEPYEEVSE